MSVSMTGWPKAGGACNNAAQACTVTPLGSGTGWAGAAVSTTWRKSGASASSGASKARRSGEVTNTRTLQSRAM